MASANKIQSRYWLSFSVIAVIVLAGVFVLGVLDRDRLAALIETGGTIESFPFVFLVLGGVCAAIAARRSGRFILWGLFALFCFFLAGEEAAWGTESVLGWTLFPQPEAADPIDLHNVVSSDIKDRLFDGEKLSISEGAWYLIYGTIVLVAGGFLLACLWLGTFGGGPLFDRGPLRHVRITNPPIQFLIAGFGLMVFANIDFFQGAGLAYMPGVWPLEETYELLGSLAFAFVGLTGVARAQR